MRNVSTTSCVITVLRRRQPAPWLGVLLTIFMIAILGCSRGGEKSLPPQAASAKGTSDAVPVTVEPVNFRRVQRIVGLVGTLHGYEEITLGAKVAGRVRKILHDVSDRVNPGELLIEIEPTDYELNVRQAQRALQVELAKLGLAEVPSAKVDVRHIPTVVQASLRRDNAKKRLERAMSLVERKAGTEEDVTEKRSDYQVAQAEYDNQLLAAQTGHARDARVSASHEMNVIRVQRGDRFGGYRSLSSRKRWPSPDSNCKTRWSRCPSPASPSPDSRAVRPTR